jgi:predicted DNA-binding transcriptional regulator AlpA
MSDPQFLTCSEVARLFRRSKSWFYEHRSELEAAGFPRRDGLVGHWPRDAVSKWFDARNGHQEQTEASTWGGGWEVFQCATSR